MLPILATGAVLAGCANDPPSASFTITPNPTNGQTVTFDGSASKPGRDANDAFYSGIAKYEWDLDGNGSFEVATQGPTVSHHYSGTASVEVMLRVTDSHGGRGTTTNTLTTDSATGETALAPSPTCAADNPPDHACGSEPVGTPLSASSEPTTHRPQPEADEWPVFDAFFGGFVAPGQLADRASVATGANRVVVLHPAAGSDVLTIYDADTRAQVAEVSIGGRNKARDIAFYRGEFYVLWSDGDVEIFDPSGSSRRVLRMPHPNPLDAQASVSFSNLAVAWNEVWSTLSVGDERGEGLVVRDATTGAVKSAGIHQPLGICMTSQNSNTATGCRNDLQSHAATPTNVTPGISALPELSVLASQCGLIRRESVFGIEAGISDFENYAPQRLRPRPFDCVDYGNPDSQLPYQSVAWHGSGSVWGMGWIGEMTHFGPGMAKEPGDMVEEHGLGADNTNALWQQIPQISAEREWQPRDSVSGNYRDIAYRAHDAQIDWSGVLTSDPTDWLHSPNGAEDKCLHYVVSNMDIYLTGYRGEHWYSPAPISTVTLLVDGTPVPGKTSGSAVGDFCLNTAAFGNGTHTLTLQAQVPGTGTVTKVNAHLKTDNAAPVATVSSPAYGRGATSTGGTIGDAHSGPSQWQLQYQAPGSSAWQAICTARDFASPPSCSWNTTAVADGTYQLRAMAVDSASDGGNTSYTAQRQIVVDNTPPDVSEIAPAEGSDFSSVIVDDSAEVIMRQTDATSGVDRTDLEYNTATDGSASGEWVAAEGTPVRGSPDGAGEWDTSTAPDGYHRMRATTHDNAGNSRTSEYQVPLAKRSPKCGTSGKRHCYGGFSGFGKRYDRPNNQGWTVVGSGGRATINLPATFPTMKNKGWSVAFVNVRGTDGAGRVMEAGARNGPGDCGPPENGWFVFGVWTPPRKKGPEQATECIKADNGDYLSGNGAREYVAVIGKDGKARMYYKVGGHLRVATIQNKKTYWGGHRGWGSGGYGETPIHGRQIVGSWSKVQYNPNPPGGGWKVPPDWIPISGGGYGYRTFSSSQKDYFCVHGPNRSCTPPSP